MILKLDRMQYQQINHALRIRIDRIKDLYREAESGIISAADIQTEADMN